MATSSTAHTTTAIQGTAQGEAAPTGSGNEDVLPVAEGVGPARSAQIVVPSVSPAHSMHLADSDIMAPSPMSVRASSLDAAIMATTSGDPADAPKAVAEANAHPAAKPRWPFSSEKEVAFRHPDFQPTGFSSKLPEYRHSSTLSASDGDSTRAIKSPGGSIGSNPEFSHPEVSPRTVPAGATAHDTADASDTSPELAEARRQSVLLAAKGVGRERSFAYFDLAADSASKTSPELQEDLSPQSMESPTSPPGILLAAAQQARRNRSRIVHHKVHEDNQNPTSSEGRLHDGGLGISLNALKREQGGIPVSPDGMGRGDRRVVEDRGHPARADEVSKDHEKARDSNGSAASPGEQSFVHPLMAHPPDPNVFIKRAQTVPTRKKYTAFIPEPLDTRRSSRFTRESVVSTPYPGRGSLPRSDSLRSMDMTEILLAPPATANTAVLATRQPSSQATLTVLLYRRAGGVPKMSTIIVARSSHRLVGRSRRNQDPSAPKPWTMTAYDDESLFHDIRAQYLWMRGVWISLLAAREVQSLRIVEYDLPGKLGDGDDCGHPGKTLASLTDAFAEEKATKLYRTPGKGRGQTEWIGWVRRLPENATSEAVQTRNVAIQLVESWSASKIGFALVIVSLASLLAVLLWIFAGRDGDDQVIQKGSSQLIVQSGLHGAAGRVPGGVALGILTLLLGWTGLGAWVWLSWLML